MCFAEAQVKSLRLSACKDREHEPPRDKRVVSHVRDLQPGLAASVTTQGRITQALPLAVFFCSLDPLSACRIKQVGVVQIQPNPYRSFWCYTKVGGSTGHQL